MRRKNINYLAVGLYGLIGLITIELYWFISNFSFTPIEHMYFIITLLIMQIRKAIRTYKLYFKDLAFIGMLNKQHNLFMLRYGNEKQEALFNILMDNYKNFEGINTYSKVFEEGVVIQKVVITVPTEELKTLLNKHYLCENSGFSTKIDFSFHSVEKH